VTTVRIPADVEREDPLLAGLTARQLAILLAAAALLYLAYLATRPWLPLGVFAALAAPPGGAALALALGRHDGLSLDRLLWAALQQALSPRLLVPAPEGVPQVPRWAGPAGGAMAAPAPLELPVRGIRDDGVIDLGGEGAALICEATSLTFALRTEAEQEALVAAFGRWLNSLGTPVQILVRAQPIDLEVLARTVEHAAAALPHATLEAAAREHASFLRSLAPEGLLQRTPYVVLREPAGVEAAGALRRRAEQAADSLRAAGVGLTVLDGERAAAVLARAAGRNAAHGAADAVVTRSSS
jgi:PrgI family protein